MIQWVKTDLARWLFCPTWHWWRLIAASWDGCTFISSPLTEMAKDRPSWDFWLCAHLWFLFYHDPQIIRLLTWLFRDAGESFKRQETESLNFFRPSLGTCMMSCVFFCWPKQGSVHSWRGNLDPNPEWEVCWEVCGSFLSFPHPIYIVDWLSDKKGA